MYSFTLFKKQGQDSHEGFMSCCAEGEGARYFGICVPSDVIRSAIKETEISS